MTTATIYQAATGLFIAAFLARRALQHKEEVIMVDDDDLSQPPRRVQTMYGASEAMHLVLFYTNALKINGTTWQESVRKEQALNLTDAECSPLIAWLFPLPFDNGNKAPPLDREVANFFYNDHLFMHRFVNGIVVFVRQIGLDFLNDWLRADQLRIRDLEVAQRAFTQCALTIARFMRCCCCMGVPQFAWQLYLIVLDTPTLRTNIKAVKHWRFMLWTNCWRPPEEEQTPPRATTLDIDFERKTFSELLRWYIDHANNTPNLEEQRNTLTRELQNSLYIGKPSSSARTAMALKEKKK